jgi:hypothetical protein
MISIAFEQRLTALWAAADLAPAFFENIVKGKTDICQVVTSDDDKAATLIRVARARGFNVTSQTIEGSHHIMLS